MKRETLTETRTGAAANTDARSRGPGTARATPYPILPAVDVSPYLAHRHELASTTGAVDTSTLPPAVPLSPASPATVRPPRRMPICGAIRLRTASSTGTATGHLAGAHGGAETACTPRRSRFSRAAGVDGGSSTRARRTGNRRTGGLTPENACLQAKHRPTRTFVRSDTNMRSIEHSSIGPCRPDYLVDARLKIFGSPA